MQTASTTSTYLLLGLPQSALNLLFSVVAKQKEIDILEGIIILLFLKVHFLLLAADTEHQNIG